MGRFKIDTGSAGTVELYARFTAEHALLDGRSPVSRYRGLGVGGAYEAVIGTLRSVRVAGSEVRSVPASFDVSDHGPDPSLDGALGGAFLKRFRLRLDPKRCLVALFADPDAPPLPRNGSGLQTHPCEEGLRVDYVRPGSPAAAAGWEAGAILVAIDGVAIDPEAPSPAWDAGSYRPAGTRVRLLDSEGRESVLVLSEYY